MSCLKIIALKAVYFQLPVVEIHDSRRKNNQSAFVMVSLKDLRVNSYCETNCCLAVNGLSLEVSSS